MPPEWEEDFWHEGKTSMTGGNNNKAGIPAQRPPLYNAEDYTMALKQLFATSQIVLTHLNDQQGNFSGSSSPDSTGSASGPPEMSMRKFANGSELLFKLEADLRHTYPSFIQDFMSGKAGDGIAAVLDALKLIQNILDDGPGIRDQRKLMMDEQKCLQCVKLCLRNIESVSQLTAYSGGLYCLVAATISTVTATRVLALEILACICTEGGMEGHYKVSEAISTLRLRLGEPIRCKLLVGALSSAPPGTFQAKGIHFLTSWIASAPSPKHKVHIQCELEEAGFNPQAIRKGAELGGAKESREVQSELDEWERVAIDVDTLTRQNCQLRNSVATLQQELATLKDKLKRMDIPQKQDRETPQSKRNPRPKRSEELVTTPADSEEEAEQIHQILEDLNNIVNNEMNAGLEGARPFPGKKEKEIVPVHLVKSPPKRSPGNNGVAPAIHKPRPWPGSSASDDDDSDIIDFPGEEQADDGNRVLPPPQFDTGAHVMRNGSTSPGNRKGTSANVRRVVEQLEKSANGQSPKMFQKNSKYQNMLSKQGPSGNMMSSSTSALLAGEPKPDYTLPNFHKQNHMISKFANFKSSKLYSSSPDNSNRNQYNNNSYPDLYEKTNGNSQFTGRNIAVNRFSPNLEPPKKINSSSGLRRSESLHASLASVETDRIGQKNGSGGNHGHNMLSGGSSNAPKLIRADQVHFPQYSNHGGNASVLSWKSMENLENGNHDENFTLRWRYPHPEFQQPSLPPHKSLTPSPKNSKGKTQNKVSAKLNTKNNVQGDFHLIADYRQNRFTKNSKSNGAHVVQHPMSPSSSSGSNPPVGGANLFARYSRKSSDKPVHLHPQQQHLIPSNNLNEYHKEKENMKMFSLPPMLMTSSHDLSHRICDLPSGLY